MRSIGELLAELGFNPESSTDAQKAFFKHLVKAAEQNQAPRKEVKAEPQQLEFKFDEPPVPKKVS